MWFLLGFIGYKDDDHKSKPLGIIFPKISADVKRHGGENKCMNFLINDDKKI